MTSFMGLRTIGWLALLAGILLQGLAMGSKAHASDEPALSPGAPLEFELAAGTARRYPVHLEAGDFLQVELHETGPRTTVALLDDKGTTLARRRCIDNIARVRLLAVAATRGTYALEVRSDDEGRSGTYRIQVGANAATESDRARVAADDTLAEASRLALEANAQSRERALALIGSAADGFSGAADRRGLAVALLQLGRLQFDAGQPASATSAERARDLFRDLADREGEGAALVDLGWTRLRSGELDEARAFFETACSHAEAVGGPRLLAVALGGIGVVFRRTGEAEQAAAAYNRALAIMVELGSRRGQGTALHNLGVAYSELGDLAKGLEYYEQALSVWRAMRDREREAITLANVGSLYMQMGDDARGFVFLEESLPITREIGLAEWEARNLANMAKVLGRRGDHARAIELGRQALEMRRRMGDRGAEASNRLNLARSLHASGETEAALQHLAEALRIQQATHDRYAEIETLAAFADIEIDRGHLRVALAHAEAALTRTEALRSAVTSPELRASFVAFKQDMYGRYIDILMRLHAEEPAAGHDAAALLTSERARARVLLEALVEARADVRQGIDPDLLACERALQKQLRDASARLSQAEARKSAEAEVARAQEELLGRSQEYGQLQARIRQESPRYAALTQPVAATLDEIRRDLLDDRTVLLEFYLGDTRSYVWAVTRTALVSHPLPGRAEMEAAARSVLGLLTERQRSRTPHALAEADRRFTGEAMELSRRLLGAIGPRLAGEWKGQRLLIVASGALAYLPFGALPSPAASGPLVRDHEVVYAPSASVLLALRREQAPASASIPTVAVLADPVFEPSDPRVSGVAASRKVARNENPVAGSSAAPVGLTRALTSLGRGGFARLPFSRLEADAIGSLVARTDLLKATDFEAARPLVTGGALGTRRIVHFATHGLLDTEHPDLSGLVLSLVDEKGGPRDGFLRMREIYNLELPADLVVLSACQTALGREIRGEGLVGLTRGFMYAGARRVVASLWQVDDASTAELMKRFYRAMLKDGQRPAAALRTAQLGMARDPRWTAPFHWAGFVLQGEWR